MKNAQSIEELSLRNEEPSEKYARGRHPNSLANLRPFQPGDCGNPGGKPKDMARQIARKLFEQNEEAVYSAMGEALLKGNAYAFSVLAERGYGKVKDLLELTGKDGGPLEYRENKLAGLSDEELKLLESIARKLAAPADDPSGNPAPATE